MKSREEILQLREEFINKLGKIQSEDELEAFKVKILGRKGQFASLMEELKSLSLEDKRTLGPVLNEFSAYCREEFEHKKKDLFDKQIEKLGQQRSDFDVTAYKPRQLTGSLHPHTQIIEQLEDIFMSMGYEIIDGPEVEVDYYNFEALNFPEEHPARDMQDTFWLNLPKTLMRTQTSNVQVRTMEDRRPPLAIISAGRCYRHEATDASHDFVFMQLEGLFIQKKTSLSNLIATMKTCLEKIFDSKALDIRVRPGYFPFVEPGIEVDATCPFCKKGCSTCKFSGWIELFPAGLVHPNVLRAGGIDPDKYSGFAFGMGLTRLVMLKFGINDIRLLHSGNLEFLSQF